MKIPSYDITHWNAIIKMKELSLLVVPNKAVSHDGSKDTSEEWKHAKHMVNCQTTFIFVSKWFCKVQNQHR